MEICFPDRGTAPVKTGIRCRSWLVVVLFALVAVPAAPAWAACDTDPYDVRIDSYYADCLPANAPVRKRVSEQSLRLADGGDSPGARIVNARKAVEKLQAEVAKHASEDDGSRKYFERLGAYLEDARERLEKLSSIEAVDQEPGKFPQLLVDFWRVDATPRDEAAGLPASMLKDGGCLDKTPPDAVCDPLFKKVIVVADDVYVAANLFRDLHFEQRARFVADAESRRDRWHAYLYDTQFQFWWELLFNRYQESRCPKGLTASLAGIVGKECHAQAKDAYGNFLGFREVPDYRTILLHPDLGMGYLEKEPKGQRFKPVLVIQAFGFQWWDWDKDKVSGLKSVSVVTTVADTSASKRVGFGVQFQYSGYSLALTSHSGHLLLTLNTGLVNQLGKVSQDKADKLKATLETPPK